MCDYIGDRRFRSRVTDQTTDVTVRRRVVDATYMASRVPATDPPPFDVADGIRCVPVGELATLVHASAGYVIVGGGKTALDAICWLLDRGTDPDDITWIRPRDSWVLNREFFQPGTTRTFAGVVLELEAMVASESVEEVFERLEADEVMLRTDRTVVPTMMKGGTVSLGELAQLRRIENVVRLGHVERIEPDQIVLERGAVPTTPGHLFVHCAAPGLSDNPPRPVFSEDTITLQVVTRVSLTLSGALQGFLETTDRTSEEKNRLCQPTAWPHTPFDFLRAVMAGIRTEMEWQGASDLSGVDRSLAAQPHAWPERERRPRDRSRASGPLPRRGLSRTREGAGVRGAGHITGTGTDVRTGALAADPQHEVDDDGQDDRADDHRLPRDNHSHSMIRPIRIVGVLRCQFVQAASEPVARLGERAEPNIQQQCEHH